MKKIKIYYNTLGHPSEMTQDGTKLYNRLHLRKNISATTFSLSKSQFNKWQFLINYETYDETKTKYNDNYKILNDIFYRYNRYDTNPLSDNNDNGQTKIKNSPVMHTSMSVGDIISINKTYYIVVNFGFKEIILK